jgi:hypothetical protein
VAVSGSLQSDPARRPATNRPGPPARAAMPPELAAKILARRAHRSARDGGHGLWRALMLGGIGFGVVASLAVGTVQWMMSSLPQRSHSAEVQPRIAASESATGRPPPGHCRSSQSHHQSRQGAVRRPRHPRWRRRVQRRRRHLPFRLSRPLFRAGRWLRQPASANGSRPPVVTLSHRPRHLPPLHRRWATHSRHASALP